MRTKLSIKIIVFSILILITMLYLLSFLFVIFNIIQLENDKLQAIAPRLVRVLSNDVLLGDAHSLKHTVLKLRSLYDLDNITLSKENISCPPFELSCILIKTSLIEPEYHILIKGNTSFSKNIIYAFIAMFLGLVCIFSLLSYILFQKIKIPLEEISKKLIPKLATHIENGNEINYTKRRSTKEIDQIHYSLVEMAKALYGSYKNIKIRSQLNDAIANSTKMFAHDVRKPFSILKIIIDNVEKEDDINKVKLIMKNSISYLNQAKMSVDNLISDILEIDSEVKMIQEPLNPEFLIHSVLSEVFLIYPESSIELKYEFNHKFKVNVDKFKTLRVFSNIVYNALQAMNYKGTVWFKTNEIENNGSFFTEFCIGNNGGYIFKETISKIFDAFYTYNKRGGTGLGLSIAQKIINLHGGNIWCKSEKDNDKYGSYVEFIFTLPSANILTSPMTFSLPNSSKKEFWHKNNLKVN